MVLSISSTPPDKDFWKAYTHLWENSIHPSVFQSPSFIKNLTKRFVDSFVICKWMKGESLKAVVFFRKKKETYVFLSDIKTDHNFFVLHQALEPEEITQFFDSLFAHIRKEKLALVLNKQPTWASYMPEFQNLIASSGLFWDQTIYSYCPIVENDDPEALYNSLNYSKNLLYQVKRIKKQLGGEYEIFTDDEGLEEWVAGFCALHVKRWNNTLTPSKYLDPKEQEHLYEIFKAWAKDGVLRRFSIKTKDNGRIAYNVCLQQKDALIGHTQTFDVDFYKYSPGRALFIIIGGWMVKEGIRKIDFGVGDENYKSYFSSKKLQVDKISISHRSNLLFILRTKLEKRIRNNQTLIDIYRRKIKPRFNIIYRLLLWESFILEY